MEKLRNLMESVLEMLYPAHACCMGCGDLSGTKDGWLCEECMQNLRRLDLMEWHVCARCGQPVVQERACRNCADWPEDGVYLARARYGYAEPVDQIVHMMKYKGVYNIANWMGEEITLMIDEGMFGSVDLLVPVPMHPARLRERGRNQALCIAQSVSRETGIPIWMGLVRTRNTKQQARRKGDKRRKGMADVFSVPDNAEMIAGKSLLLIDDVITTGTTVNSCARMLYAKGAECVCAAAFAGHLSVKENTQSANGSNDYAK